MSLVPTELSPLSTTTAVFTTFIDAPENTSTIVGSSVVFPSVSSPSSAVSETFPELPGLLAITEATLTTLPEAITD